MAKRRGNSEGSIYQRKSDGRWVAALTVGMTAAGHPRRRTLYGKTRKEVAEQLQLALRMRAEGRYSTGARQTVAQYAATWLAGVTGSVRPLTERNYRQAMHADLLPVIGHIELVKLTPDDVSALFQGFLAAGRAPSTVCHIRTILRIALNQAMERGLVVRNVAALVPPPRIPARKTPVLSQAQARAFLAACQGHPDEALFVVALTCGLRHGEILGLQWQDIDLEAGTLEVVRSLQRIGAVDTLVELKSTHSRRTLSLPPVAVAALRAHRAQQLREQLVAGPAWQQLDLVFTNDVGTPRPRTNTLHHLHALLARAGLPQLCLHDLRHCCASLLLAANVQPKYVQELLGHASITITLDRYSHALPAARVEVADHMERLVATG
jgi:integrase